MRSYWGVLKLSLVLLLCLGLPTQTKAQDDSTISISEFWSRLDATHTRLEQGITEANASAISQDFLPRWMSVRRVTDGSITLELNLSWITKPLESGDVQALQQLRDESDALLQYHARQNATPTNPLSLGALADILSDPRYQYESEDPMPLPTVTSSAPAQPSLQIPVPEGMDFGLQLIVLVAAIAVIAIVVVSLFRSLATRPVKLRKSALPDDPTTEQGAMDRAQESADYADYRNAVRYLYLAALLKLDEQGLLHYDATLTNREHVSQVREHTALRENLQQVVSIFDDVWYGILMVDQAFYEAYRMKVQRLWQPS